MFGIFKKINTQPIVKAIQEAEKDSTGEIHVHISYQLLEKNLLVQARKRFYQLNMHQTQHRNAVLFYFNAPLRKFAFYGDEQIHQKVTQIFWDQLAQTITQTIQNHAQPRSKAALVNGIKVGVLTLGQSLKQHFPLDPSQVRVNELSDEVTDS